MSLEFEAQLSGKLADILSGRLNTGTPQCVLEKTKGMRFSDGQNVLFLTGLLPVSSAEPKKKLQRSITLDQNQLFWTPEPSSSRGSSRRVKLFEREDYFGYRPASAARDGSKSSVEPRAGRKPLEYEQWERSAGDTKLHTCLSKRLVADCVKRPQLYPMHASGFNGESMHSFITGSKYNRKNYTSPHHLQLFDCYSPPIRPEYIESKYRRFRRRNTQCRVISSETEFTSRLKSPLPKEATSGDQISAQPTSARSSSTAASLTPRRPSTQQGSKVNTAKTSVRRLNSAPLSSGHTRRISHLQGFTKEVFDKALSKHAPRYVMSSGSAYTPRPQSSSASSLKSRSGIISEGNSDCVICQSPDIWKAYVESQQQNNEQQSAPDEARPTTADFSAQSDVEAVFNISNQADEDDKSEAAVIVSNNEAAKFEVPVQNTDQTEVRGEKKSFIRVFATEPVLDIDDEDVEISEGLSRQTPGSVTGVEIIVREKPPTSEFEAITGGLDPDNQHLNDQNTVSKVNDANENSIVINEESLINELEPELQLENNPNNNDSTDLKVFETRHLSSPEISLDNSG
ncbi:uncharacterized protein LOC142344690 [Convolutriloba macropyga]|uniref:uncharacterized protein LOC142344690 n=1 Tax=Convolutriloba macropyga TaxID=536237 RepID=UPI003F524E85